MDDRRERERFQLNADAIQQLDPNFQYRGEEAELLIHVSDLSRWGMGFRCAFEPEPGRDINVTMSHRVVPIRFRATVRWSKQLDGEWCGGCELAQELGNDFLMDLSTANILNPNASREATWVRAIVRSNVAPDEKLSLIHI